MTDDVFKRLGREIIEYFEYDLFDRDNFLHRGTVKKFDSLICKTRTYMLNVWDCQKTHSDIGEWQKVVSYDDDSIADLLEGIHICASYKNAEKVTSDYLDAHGNEDILSRLYLTLFGFKCISTFVSNGMKIDEQEIENMVNLFEKDLDERALGIKTTLGLQGICSEDEITSKDKTETLVIRPAKIEDISDKIVVRNNGLDELDITNRPYLPDLTGILEIYLNGYSVRRDDLGFMYVKRWGVSNTAFDLFLSGVNLETDRALDLFYLFQSKQIPILRTWKVSFHLKNLSNTAIYEKDVQINKKSIPEVQPFKYLKDFGIPFQNFCNRMRNIDFIDRIFQYSKDPKDGFHHVEKPLEIAYKRYLKLMGQHADIKQKIHDTVETLEAFFTPEKPKTREEFLKYNKIFIKRIHKLIGIFNGLDPNSTKRVLDFGFKIRSEISHRGQGWDEDYADANSEGTKHEEFSEEDLKPNRYEYYNLQRLSGNLLNYLRIGIICRIVAGMPDRDFIDMLDTDSGRVHLKDLFSGLFEILSVDQMSLVKFN